MWSSVQESAYHRVGPREKCIKAGAVGSGESGTQCWTVCSCYWAKLYTSFLEASVYACSAFSILKVFHISVGTCTSTLKGHVIWRISYMSSSVVIKVWETRYCGGLEDFLPPQGSIPGSGFSFTTGSKFGHLDLTR